MERNETPALFELNKDSEATGIVYHFCSNECRTKFRNELEKSVALKEAESNDFCRGSICDECMKELD